MRTEGWLFAQDGSRTADSVRQRQNTGAMADVVVRQRSLIPLGERGPIEGWMDDDVASAATQLFGSGPSGLLVIDARELLTSTARVVGAQLGELHFKALMAMITLHVAQGMPEDGRGAATAGELSRVIWGEDRERGGSNTKKLLRALFDLRQAQFTVPGYDMVNHRPAAGVSDTSLLINLFVDETILKAYAEAGRHQARPGRLRQGARWQAPGDDRVALASRLHAATRGVRPAPLRLEQGAAAAGRALWRCGWCSPHRACPTARCSSATASSRWSRSR